MRWLSAIDTLIPAAARAQVETQRRARVVVGLVLLGLISSAASAVASFVELGARSGHLASLIGAAVAVWLLVDIHRRGRLGFAGDVLVVQSVLAVTAVCMDDGLTRTGASFWLPVLPVMAGYIGDRLGVIVTATMCATSVAGLTWLELERADALISPSLIVARSVALLLAIAYASVAAALFRSAHAAQRMEVARIARRMQTVVDNLTDGVVVTNAAGEVLACNARWCAMFDIADYHNSLVGRSVWQAFATARVPPSDLEKHHQQMEDELNAQHRVEAAMVSLSDGRVIERDLVPIRFDGETDGFLWAYRDVSAHAALARDLRRLVDVDSLTGLKSRIVFERELEERCEHTDRGFALLYLDLDGFKPINDNYGHDAGDLVLAAIGRRLSSTLESGELAARLGGDEFAILLNRTLAPRSLRSLGNDLLALIQAPVALPGGEVSVGASIGVALFPDAGESAATLIKAADSAMYRSKRGGRNRVTVVGDRISRALFRVTGGAELL